MFCAAGVCCKLPGQTPVPTFYTIHKCREGCGYLNGICGEKDPIDDFDCKRVCEGAYLRPTATKRRDRVTFVVLSIQYAEFGVGHFTLCCSRQKM